jgi:thiamine-phosphate pyrophosphorylase
MLLGPNRLLGLSVHRPEELPSAAEKALDYLMVGTIFPSPSHPGGTVGGMKRIGSVARVSGLPQVAIGGVSADRVAEVLSAGAHGVAVLSAVWDAADPEAAVETLLEALEKGRE